MLLFVNGLPLCVIELKNPADANATIYDAWEQINIRYWRDIPHLLHYCPLACISDGVKTRLGTVRTPYEHFYAWRRVNDGDEVSTLPFGETENMVKGVYAPERFLEIFRDYIYFQDSIYDSDEREIVCRYPQFFAARRLEAKYCKIGRRKKAVKAVHILEPPAAAKPTPWRFLPASYPFAALRLDLRPSS